ncbi:unnamed protein product [Boreogadus saida]
MLSLPLDPALHHVLKLHHDWLSFVDNNRSEDGDTVKRFAACKRRKDEQDGSSAGPWAPGLTQRAYGFTGQEIRETCQPAPRDLTPEGVRGPEEVKTLPGRPGENALPETMVKGRGLLLRYQRLQLELSLVYNLIKKKSALSVSINGQSAARRRCSPPLISGLVEHMSSRSYKNVVAWSLDAQRRVFFWVCLPEPHPRVTAVAAASGVAGRPAAA